MTFVEYAEVEKPILKMARTLKGPLTVKIILKKKKTENSHILISKFPTKLWWCSCGSGIKTDTGQWSKTESGDRSPLRGNQGACLAHALTPSVNGDFARLRNRRAHSQHHACASWATRSLAGSFARFARMNFTVKALAAAAFGLHRSDTVAVLCEPVLWLRYCYIMVKLRLLPQPGERLRACRERIDLPTVPSLLPAPLPEPRLRRVQRTGQTVWTAKQLASWTGAAIHPHTQWGQIIFNESAKTIQQGRDGLFNKWCSENWIPPWSRMKLYPYLTLFTKIN